MRILYVDIDSLRPDHLGCFGYHRNTSPTIDRVAADGVRFTQCYASDVPCLPSRSSLFSGRFGIHHGAIGHGGTPADPFLEGRARGFRSTLGQSSWMQAMRAAGLKTVTISPFGERHSAWHWYANFVEVYNTGWGGLEKADQISSIALDWIKRNGVSDNWFLDINFWDPHTPYRAPKDFGEPFADEPLPAWLTDDVLQAHLQGAGPHCAQDIGDHMGFYMGYPRQPRKMNDMHDVRMMFDGYDTGIRYADEHLARVLEALDEVGVLDDTAIVISGDHGESLGELNIYADHQTADECVTHLPLIIKWPGCDEQAGRVDDALHYHFDFAATLVELAKRSVPKNWDAESFAEAFREGRSTGRDYLVVSQAAWSCQRAVRFDNYICVRSYHDGYHDFPDVMLFDLDNDPHEQNDIAPAHPDIVGRAMHMLEEWHAEMMRTATHAIDPMWTVIDEGGPFHVRGHLPHYLKKLERTGRGDVAARLTGKHPHEV